MVEYNRVSGDAWGQSLVGGIIWDPPLTQRGNTMTDTYHPFKKDLIPKQVTRDDSMSFGAHRLYTILVGYADHITGKCFPSQQTLASRMNFKDRHSISPYVQELIRHKHISAQLVRLKDKNGNLRRRAQYMYTLTIPTAAAKESARKHGKVKWHIGYQPVDY